MKQNTKPNYEGDPIEAAKWYLSISEDSLSAKQLEKIGVDLNKRKQWAREILEATGNDISISSY